VRILRAAGGQVDSHLSLAGAARGGLDPAAPRGNGAIVRLRRGEITRRCPGLFKVVVDLDSGTPHR
ncbi:MAG: hypothetical protein ACRDVE_12925, partial [Actinocrinis sp.]